LVEKLNNEAEVEAIHHQADTVKTSVDVTASAPSAESIADELVGDPLFPS
jgi:hypothetical protein